MTVFGHHRHNTAIRSDDDLPCTRPNPNVPTISVDQYIEEETVPGYKARKFYPVYIGQVFNQRYKTVAKLGYGMASTIWLCRDMKLDQLMTLKVGTAQAPATRPDSELSISRYLSPIEGGYPEKDLIRLIKDEFRLSSASGTPQCLLFDPLGISWRVLVNRMPEKAFTRDLLRGSMQMLLLALDFLHKANVVHTDISPNNILLGVHDPSIFLRIKKEEDQDPSPRKILPDRTIYLSRTVPFTKGYPVITDFGAARMGEVHSGDIMPGVYRAPEVILGMEWDCKVDIWSAGVMIWNLFEGGSLVNATSRGQLDDELHLAEMVSLMGPPPKEFLKRSDKCRQYWDCDGNWIASTPIPEQSLETREHQLSGNDKDRLLTLMRKFLRRLPEERPPADLLIGDDFLMQSMPAA